MKRTWGTRLCAAVAVAGGLALTVSAVPAWAGINQGALVSTNPANFTPNINDGATYGIAQVGSTMFVGGDFTSVTPSTGGAAVTRRGLVAFNATTGAISSIAPVFNGEVDALVSDGTSLYAGGTFSTVAGIARRGVVKLNPSTGAVDTAFNAGLTSTVNDLKIAAGRLFVAMDSTAGVRALSLSTGANTGYAALTLASTLGAQGGAIGFSHIAINPQGTRLVATGNFTSINGLAHIRAAMIDLGATSATVSSWYYPGLEKGCQLFFVPNYLRGVDFSPDGSYFVLIGTGRNPVTPADLGTAICDATARFETANLSPTVPTWINYTGGDTPLAVNITDATVYVQGHFRWLDNAGGTDGGFGGTPAVPAPTAVTRSGIGALDIATGKALSWNPGKGRGVGGKALLTTSQGLWVGSDTTDIGGETHARIALLPLTGGTVNQPPAPGFTSSCTGLACSVTSTATDGDGTVATVAWNFGDGSTATGTTAGHTYGAAGTYLITQTVTDNGGATATTSRSVTVATTTPPAGALAFRAGTAATANSTSVQVTVPATVRAGDTMVLFAGSNTNVTVGTPAGWTQEGTALDTSLRSVVWSRTATAADAGSAVRVTLSATAKANLQLVAYSGSTAADRVGAVTSAVEGGTTATHTTPAVTVTAAGSQLVSYWADQSSASTGWTLPAGTTERLDTTGAGSGRITSAIGDQAVAAGTAGGLTATADSSNGKAVMWSVVLNP
jgi:hypothetical protein